MDHVWTKIKSNGSDLLLIGGVYHSPSCNLSDSVDSLCNLLSNLKNCTHLLICGDFNFGEISWSEMSGSTSNSHAWFILIFQQVNQLGYDSPSSLDLIFTNKPDMINNLS